jgi:hypothetical protein
MSVSMMHRLGTAAAKCAFIIVVGEVWAAW